jgi:hypothetical protein
MATETMPNSVLSRMAKATDMIPGVRVQVVVMGKPWADGALVGEKDLGPPDRPGLPEAVFEVALADGRRITARLAQLRTLSPTADEMAERGIGWPLLKRVDQKTRRVNLVRYDAEANRVLVLDHKGGDQVFKREALIATDAELWADGVPAAPKQAERTVEVIELFRGA